MASFDSTDFGELKLHFFADILLSLLLLDFKVTVPVIMGGRHSSIFDKN